MTNKGFMINKKICALLCVIFLCSCHSEQIPLYSDMTNKIQNEVIKSDLESSTEIKIESGNAVIDEDILDYEQTDIESDDELQSLDINEDQTINSENYDVEPIYTVEKKYLEKSYRFATFSVINNGYALLYKLDKNSPNYKNKTIAVNAGHGTKNGTMQKTYSHPDFSPKVSGGTTAKGSVKSAAVSDGTNFLDGTTEASANLKVAIELKNILLKSGYSVLMIREDDDCRLDNIARTVLANELSDVHISIHFDYTDYNKGIFFIAPSSDKNYQNMEPLKSNKHRIMSLGNYILYAFAEMGEKIWRNKGILYSDLTQLSFSTNASVDIELGDRATKVTDNKIKIFAEGIKRGVEYYINSPEYD